MLLGLLFYFKGPLYISTQLPCTEWKLLECAWVGWKWEEKGKHSMGDDPIILPCCSINTIESQTQES